MSMPRLEIDLEKIYHNACSLVERLANRGIAVSGVSKAVLGSPEVANTLLRAGVSSIGDSRIENIEAMRHAKIHAPMMLIRSPMLSQAARVVAHADVSLNTEMVVIRQLSMEAQRAHRTHGIVLMVELGDLREGIMPEDLIETVRETLSLPNLELKGIGTNLACRSGVSPDANNMARLSELTDAIETTFDVQLEIVSGGNSANLDWVFASEDTGRINHLRLGESILLGCEPLHRTPIDGLHTDAITLVAEVIETKTKPTQPSGVIAQTAFGDQPIAQQLGLRTQSILAVGVQDTDPLGLRCPVGTEVLGASSDHLIVQSPKPALFVGSEMSFQLNYSALLRAMTSPFVSKRVITKQEKTTHPNWTSPATLTAVNQHH